MITSWKSWTKSVRPSDDRTDHNEDVGGVADSQHIHGRAADVYADGEITPLQIAAIAEQAGADGIGIYDDFCHIDTRGTPARWCEW